MSREKKKPAPTQRTPKGYEIPVRPRREVLDAFRKVVRPLPEKAPKKG
jgi:hypothetical protein